MPPGNCRWLDVSSAISQATPEGYPQRSRRGWAGQGGHHRAAHGRVGCSAPGPALLSLESLVSLESSSAAQAPQHLQHARWHSSQQLCHALPCPATRASGDSPQQHLCTHSFIPKPLPRASHPSHQGKWRTNHSKHSHDIPDKNTAGNKQVSTQTSFFAAHSMAG